jgi:hypothetical protein
MVDAYRISIITWWTNEPQTPQPTSNEKIPQAPQKPTNRITYDHSDDSNVRRRLLFDEDVSSHKREQRTQNQRPSEDTRARRQLFVEDEKRDDEPFRREPVDIPRSNVRRSLQFEKPWYKNDSNCSSDVSSVMKGWPADLKQANTTKKDWDKFIKKTRVQLHPDKQTDPEMKKRNQELLQEFENKRMHTEEILKESCESWFERK